MSDSRYLLKPQEIKSLRILEADPEFRNISIQITGADLRLTQLNCGTWVFIPMFPADENIGD